jgi:hypothetical protein
MEVIQLLVAEINKFCNKYLDILDDSGHSQLPDMTVKEMYIFLAIIIHNSVNGTCQGHTEMLLGDCRTVLHTFIHQHNDVTDFLIS